MSLCRYISAKRKLERRWSKARGSMSKRGGSMEWRKRRTRRKAEKV